MRLLLSLEEFEFKRSLTIKPGQGAITPFFGILQSCIMKHFPSRLAVFHRIQQTAWWSWLTTWGHQLITRQLVAYTVTLCIMKSIPSAGIHNNHAFEEIEISNDFLLTIFLSGLPVALQAVGDALLSLRNWFHLLQSRIHNVWKNRLYHRD